MANEAQRLKYLGVELLRKDASKSSRPEIGLFRGLKERSDGEGEDKKVIRLILIGEKDKENDLKALNLAVINVLSLKMMYGDTKELVVFKANDVDQAKALELLSVALEEFQKEKRMVDNDPEIVDITTFDDVPEEFFSPAEKKKTTTATSNTPGYSYGVGGGGYGGAYQPGDWQKKEDERKKKKLEEEKMRWTPTLIGRKGDLPGLKALNAIKKKIQQQAAGEFEHTLLDPDPDDTTDVDEKKIYASQKK